MNENFTTNTRENDGFVINSEESDYKNLITKLKEISASITLLRKKYKYKF